MKVNVFFSLTVLILLLSIGAQGSPSRIVTLNPEITETVAELLTGKEQTLIGRSSFSDFPKWVTGLPEVSDFSTLFYEKLVSLKPDLIIGMGDGVLKTSLQKLQRLNIKLEVANYFSIQTYLAWISHLGNLLGTKKKAQSLLTLLDNDLMQFKKNALLRSKHIKILILVSLEPLMIAGDQTYINDYSELLGFENMGQKLGKGYIRVNPESLATIEIEKVLVLQKNPSSRKLVFKNPKIKWEFLGTPDSLLRMSPRMIEGIHIFEKAVLK